MLLSPKQTRKRQIPTLPKTIPQPCRACSLSEREREKEPRLSYSPFPSLPRLISTRLQPAWHHVAQPYKYACWGRRLTSHNIPSVYPQPVRAPEGGFPEGGTVYLPVKAMTKSTATRKALGNKLTLPMVCLTSAGGRAAGTRDGLCAAWWWWWRAWEAWGSWCGSFLSFSTRE